MNALKAREILAYGKKNGFYEFDLPEDDAKAIADAEDLASMAKVAWDQYVRDPEVEALLTMADVEHATNGDQPKPEPEIEIPEPEEAVETEVPREEPTDQVPEEVDLAHTEPWEGYAQDKGSDVIAAINVAVEKYNEADLMDLLAHVWHYEAHNKDRQMVTMHLEKVAKQVAKRDPDDDKREVSAEPDNTEDNTGSDKTPANEQEQIENNQLQPTPAEIAPEADKVDETPPPVPLEENQETPANALTEGELLPGAADTPEPVKVDKAEAPSESTPEVKLPNVDDLLDQGTEPEIDEDYANLIEHVEEELRRERLHAPKSPPQEEVPDLPWDWTKMTDNELQKFYGIYTSLAYYKNYVLAHEERMAMHCKSAAEEFHRDLLQLADKYDDHNKAKTMTLLEAEIESDDNVKTWRRRQRKHEIFAQAARQERDSYNKLVESLSRLESMRDNEFDRSGQRQGRSRK